MIAGNRTAGHTLIQRRRWLAPPTGHGRSKVLMDAIADPDPRVGLLQAQTRNMRSKCRCSCVLQFTLCHAFSSVLHRPPSQLIHCIVLYSKFFLLSQGKGFHASRGFVPGGKREQSWHETRASGSSPPALTRPSQPGDRSPLGGPATDRLPACELPDPSRARDPGGGYQSLKTAKPWPLMILPQVHLRKPCYDFYFL